MKEEKLSQIKIDDVLNIAYNNAGVSYSVDNNSSDYKFPNLRKLLNYYSDIPSKPRWKYDGDAICFYNFDKKINNIDNKKWEAEHGDIMTSIWIPLTYYLGISKQLVAGKNKNNINKVLEKLDENKLRHFVCFEKLAKNYFTRGNLLLLPEEKGNLNGDRGRLYEDKLDKFLYHSFKDEKLSRYFKNNDNNLKAWIESEGLECMFDGDIEKDNIKSLIGQKERIKEYMYKELNDEEWELYFKNLFKVIEYRNNKGIKPHLPLKF